jgi:hypothetical protein
MRHSVLVTGAATQQLPLRASAAAQPATNLGALFHLYAAEHGVLFDGPGGASASAMAAVGRHICISQHTHQAWETAPHTAARLVTKTDER